MFGVGRGARAGNVLFAGEFGFVARFAFFFFVGFARGGFGGVFGEVPGFAEGGVGGGGAVGVRFGHFGGDGGLVLEELSCP